MSNIFIATDASNHAAWAYCDRPTEDGEGNFASKVGGHCLRWNAGDAPPPGKCVEYRLVSVPEFDANAQELRRLRAAVDDRKVHVKDATTSAVRELLYGAVEAEKLQARIKELKTQLVQAKALHADMKRQNLSTNARITGLRRENLALKKQTAKYKLDSSRVPALRQANMELRDRLSRQTPGGMPECARKLIDWAKTLGGPYTLPGELVKAVEDHYAPPEGFEQLVVDDAHQISEEDAGLKVVRRNGGVDVIDKCQGGLVYFYGADICNYSDGRLFPNSSTGFDITHIFRPRPPAFKFTGTPGRYITNEGDECDVCLCGKKLIAVINDQDIVVVSPDGSFEDGGWIEREAK